MREFRVREFGFGKVTVNCHREVSSIKISDEVVDLVTYLSPRPLLADKKDASGLNGHLSNLQCNKIHVNMETDHDEILDENAFALRANGIRGSQSFNAASKLECRSNRSKPACWVTVTDTAMC